MKTAILGGGALGLTLALRLRQGGDDVVLFEREPEPGGLAAGFPVGPAHLEKFYHHLFKSDQAIIDLISELGLSEKLVWKQANTSFLMNGSIHKFSPATLPFFQLLPIISRYRMVAALGYLKLSRNYHQFENITAARWLEQTMGKEGFDIFMRPLLEQKFGSKAEEISMAWFWSRIHCRSFALGYLRGGFQQFYDRLNRKIGELGGETHFEQTVTQIKTYDQAKMSVQTDQGEIIVDRVISTLPTRISCQLTPELPDDYRSKYDWGEAYGAHCLILAINHPLTNVYWLNINDKGYPFLAVIEHTNYMPTSDYDGKHLIYLGNYLPMNHSLFKKSGEEILAEYIPYIKKINPAFEKEWIVSMWSFKAAYAQPIVTLEYPSHIPPHETPLNNLYMANMFQIYPQDRGQNYSIAMANHLAKKLLASS